VAAPVVLGLTNFITSNITNLTVWDGEIPYQNTTQGVQTPLEPPPQWPAFRFKMPEEGMQREWKMADAYDDFGIILMEIYATTRQQLENQDPAAPGLINQIEALFASGSGWANIPLGTGFFVFHMTLERWTSVQMEFVRTQQGSYLYEGKLWYRMGLHGAISTS
jgi:hypothetical protein